MSLSLKYKGVMDAIRQGETHQYPSHLTGTAAQEVWTPPTLTTVNVLLQPAPLGYTYPVSGREAASPPVS